MGNKTRTAKIEKDKAQRRKKGRIGKGSKQSAAGEPQKRTNHGGRGRSGSRSNEQT